MTWTREKYLREVLLGAAVLFCVGYSWLSTSEVAPNERARIYLAMAMVDRGEVKIDKEVDQFGNHWDLSKKDGHFYCNKPPGSSLLGAVSYGFARMFTERSDWSLAGLFQLMRFTVMLPLALLGFVAVRRWMELLDFSDATVDIASVGWMMGSAAFHYAGAFFSHHIVAVLLVTAFWLVEWVRRQLRSGSGRAATLRWSHVVAMSLAGLTLGLAGLNEYQAGISSLFAALWLLGCDELRRWELLGPFTVAAGACVVGLFYYNQLAFGGPLEFSYFYHISGGDGVALTYPQWEHFVGVTISIHRGLLTNAPWVLLIVPGGIYLWGRRHHRGTAMVLVAIVVYRILFLSGYKWWSGDWGFGPRHLVPVMGVMAMLAAAALDRWRPAIAGEGLAKGLFVAGMAHNQIQVAFIGELPLGAENPIMDVALPMMREGVPGPNLWAAWTGRMDLMTLAPLSVVAGGLAIFVLVRGLGRNWSLLRGGGIVLVSFVPVAALGAIIYLAGPTWDEGGRKRFRDILEQKLEDDVKWHRKDDEST